ncbi:MAG TPA: GFA family protein [Devosiaceae bacterium]
MIGHHTALPHFPVEGGCICGSVRYRLKAMPLTVYRCHCKDCQRSSGAGFSMSAIVPAEAIELISGEPVVFEKTAQSGNRLKMMRCGTCGTLVWNRPASGNAIVLKPGTLDDASWAVPVGNIWTASAVPWAGIDRGDVNFEGQPTSRQPLFDAWARVMGVAEGEGESEG